MSDEISSCRQQATDILAQFPEVKWDRFAGQGCYLTAFGWIERADGRLDFMSISFRKGEPSGYVTSSAEHSAEFARRLGFGDHVDCEPITELRQYNSEFEIIDWQK